MYLYINVDTEFKFCIYNNKDKNNSLTVNNINNVYFIIKE